MDNLTQAAQQQSGGPVPNEKHDMTAHTAKKIKTSNHANSASKPRRRKSLSLLPNMPLDILFEVLGHLTPKDLINISRANKTMRATLIDNSATGVWKTSRLRVADGPEPPRGMAEWKWAALIFTNNCTSCGMYTNQRAEFLLQRRICKKCKEQNASFYPLGVDYPDLNPTVEDLACTDFHDDFFWLPDVDRLIQVVEGYQARIREGDQNAQSELDQFVETRKKRLREMREDAAPLTAWDDKIASEEKKLKEESIRKRNLEMCKERFHALGYSDADLQDMHLENEVRSGRRMAEKGWEHFRSRIEPRYFQNKHRRLNDEDLLLRRERRQMADRVYRSFAMTIQPRKWKFLPSTEVVCGLSPYRHLITAERSAPLVNEVFFALQGLSLLRALEDAVRALKCRLIQSAPQRFGHDPRDTSDVSLEKALEKLELVENSYFCMSCEGSLWGWDEISSHFCAMNTDPMADVSAFDRFAVGSFESSAPQFKEEFPHYCTYNSDDFSFSRFIAWRSGLNPGRATVERMDELDYRYTCKLCSGESIAYTWRAYVVHLQVNHPDSGGLFREAILEPHDPNIPQPADMVDVLSSTDIYLVKEQEYELERGPKSKWACMHCAAHLTHSIPYADVIEHVKETHEIENPREDFDLILLRRVRKDYAIPYVPTPPSGEQSESEDNA